METNTIEENVFYSSIYNINAKCQKKKRDMESENFFIPQLEQNSFFEVRSLQPPQD